MKTQPLRPTVIVGNRIYKAHFAWSRRDKIFLGDRCIGIINLQSDDRVGRTVSLVSAASVAGRQINWCVEQSALPVRQRQTINHQ